MVYKKYIKQGGKVFGPYLYETKRVDGRIVTTYLGKHVEKKRSLIIPYFIIGFILLVLLIFVGFKYQGITGSVIFEQVRTLGDVILGDNDSVEEVENIIDEPLEEEILKEEFEEEKIPEGEIEEKELEESEEVEEEVAEIEDEPEEELEESEEEIDELIEVEKETKDIGSEKRTKKEKDFTDDKPDKVEVESKIPFDRNDSIIDEEIFINTTQFNVVLGEPVKWLKKIENIKGPRTLYVEIPKSAKNITINKIKKERRVTKEKPDKEGDKDKKEILKEKDIEIDKDDRIRSSEKKAKSTGIFSFFQLIMQTPRITGFAVQDGENEIRENKDKREIVIEIDETEDGVEIEYYTDAPFIGYEENLAHGKRVQIVGPDDVHYERVLSFTEFSENFSVVNPGRIKIYWLEEGVYLEPLNVLDLDNNGVYDYVEWIVPRLSNQTFDIILIIKAEHLDSNRTFISDIFESVRELDNNWSETIPDTHYVRVTFEIPLDNSRDITLYPRIVSGNPRIEVYEFNGTEIIAEFTDIISNQYNKVLLINLIGSQDTFDLRIVDGDVEFDHIIDPTGEFFEACTDGTDITGVWDVTGTADNLWQEGGGGNNNKCWAENGFSNMTIKTAIDLTGVSYANLSFERNCDNLEGGDHLRAYVNSSVESWQLLLDTANNDPITEEFDLSNNITMTIGVHIRFELDVTANNEDCTLDNINVTSYPLIDNEFPIFSSFTEEPANNTVYVSGAIYEFNVTITSTNGTAGLEFDGVNYTASNLTASLFNSSVIDLAAGSYTYYWWAFGNGTSNNYNTTTLREYTLAKATGDVEVYLNNGTANVTVERGTSVQINTSRLVGEGTFTLYEDGTVIAEGTITINSTTANNVGSINITAILASTQNYTSDTQTRFIDVEDTTVPNVTINFPTNVTYNAADLPLNFNVTLSENGSVMYSLDDGVNNITMLSEDEGQSVFGTLFNSTNDSIADGTYPFNVYANDTAGNNNFTEFTSFTVDATPPQVTINFPIAITYGPNDLPLNFNVTLSENGSIMYSLDDGVNNITMTGDQDPFGTEFNATNSSIASGTYTFSVYANDTAGNNNYTESVTFDFDSTPPNASFVSPTPANGSTQTNTDIFVNLSTADESGDHYAFVDFDDDLVLWMRMDDTNSTGDPTDLSSYSNNGTLGATVTINSTGYFGNASHFDGTGDNNYVQIANSDSLDVTELTISAWINPRTYGDHTNGLGRILDRAISGNGFIFSLNKDFSGLGTNNLLFRDGDEWEASNSGIIKLDVWQHVAVTVNVSTVTFYVNGSAEGFNAGTHSITNNDNVIRIGSQVGGGGSLRFNGTIDEVLIFNRSLSAGEISALYNASANQYFNNFTNLNETTHTFTGYVVDIFGNKNQTEERVVTISAVTDNEFPIFSNFQEVPANNTAYVSGATYEFNVTITSTNGTAGLEFDGTNYTASNLTSSLFNVSIIDLAAGSYTYYWWSYGNGTSNNYNTTAGILRYYTVARATGDVEVYLDGNTANVTVELGNTVTYNSSVLTGEITTVVYEDGTLVANGTATTNTTTINNVGSINITAILVQSQNYTSDSQERFIDVEDTILPLVDIVTPDNSTNHSISNVNVNYTVSDLDLQACWYTNSSGQFNYTITCGNNLTTQTWDQGDNVVTVYANDSTGNENSSSVTFFVDSIVPLISFAAPTEVDFANISSDSINVTVTVTETNEDTIKFYLYNGTGGIVNISNFTTGIRNLNFTGLSDGNYTYNVTINDTLGNVNGTETRHILLDPTNPIINYVAPTQISGLSLNQNYIEINITASDDNLETIEIRLYNSTQDQIEINTSAISAFYINYSSLSDGLYFYNTTANDTIGNEANLETRNITLDTINPSINLTYPLNTTYTSVQTQLNYTVSDDNLGTCWYSIDGGATNITITCGENVTGLDSGQGSSTWTIYVNDSANNENSSSVTFFIDSITPTINFVSPTETDGGFITRTEILINVTSSDDNLENITIRLYNSTQDQIEINTSTTSPFFINYSGLGDGLYFFNATATDIVNTQNSTGTRNVTIDTANPSVIGLIPSESSAFNTSTSIEIAANVTDDTTNISAVLLNITLPNLTINQLTLTNVVDNKYNTSFNIPELDGRYNLTFIANDTANNVNSSETTFFNVTDVTVVLVTINVPESKTYSISSFDFNVTLNENGSVMYSLNDGINNITMRGDGGGFFGTDFNATNSSIADGGYTFSVYANDTSGNNNYTESVQFTVDTSIDDDGGTTTGGTTGGSGGSQVISFSINKDLINVKIKQGETKREVIIIENTGNRNRQFDLEVQEIERFVILNEESFTISPENSKEINADFFASENEPADIHAGRIIVRTGPISKAINVILEIREKAALFDTRSELADVALTKSQKLKVKINISDIGDLNKRVDVILEYFIKDFEGNEIKLEEETIGVFGSLVIEREFSIPNWLEPGDYLFSVKLTYLDSVATSANRFTIEKEPSFITFIRENFVMLLILILLIILFMVIRLRKLVIRRYLIRYYLSSIYVEYLRIKYELVLIWVKYKAGLYQEKILTIKHLPVNILGTIKNYINKRHALYLQAEYDKKMKLSNEQKKSKEQKKKSNEKEKKKFLKQEKKDSGGL